VPYGSCCEYPQNLSLVVGRPEGPFTMILRDFLGIVQYKLYAPIYLRSLPSLSLPHTSTQPFPKP
jgi:hypothetical protein